jgi:hypothetical protein
MPFHEEHIMRKGYGKVGRGRNSGHIKYGGRGIESLLLSVFPSKM